MIPIIKKTSIFIFTLIFIFSAIWLIFKRSSTPVQLLIQDSYEVKNIICKSKASNYLSPVNFLTNLKGITYRVSMLSNQQIQFKIETNNCKFSSTQSILHTSNDSVLALKFGYVDTSPSSCKIYLKFDAQDKKAITQQFPIYYQPIILMMIEKLEMNGLDKMAYSPHSANDSFQTKGKISPYMLIIQKNKGGLILKFNSKSKRSLFCPKGGSINVQLQKN